MTEWRNRDRARQLIEFDNLTYGFGAAPTDIDAVYEGHNGFWVLFEVKYKNAPLPTGQRLCLERAVNDFERAGKNAVAIVAEHTVTDHHESVQLAKCSVRAAYRNGKWYQMDNEKSVKTVLDSIEWAWSRKEKQ